MENDVVTVRVGKAGLSEGVVGEIVRVLRKRKVVKVKFLRNYREAVGEFDRRRAAEELARRTGSRVVYIRGYTVLLRAEE